MILIQNGVIDQKMMKKLRFTIDDLMEELRSNNIFNLEDVQYAIVETNGKLSVMLKYKAQTVTPEILNLKALLLRSPTPSGELFWAGRYKVLERLPLPLWHYFLISRANKTAPKRWRLSA